MSNISPRNYRFSFVLVFINLETLEIFTTSATLHPNSAWIEQQARNFLMHADDLDDKPKHLIRDRDTKFTANFDDIFKSENFKPIKLSIQSPNLNARCERVIQSI